MWFVRGMHARDDMTGWHTTRQLLEAKHPAEKMELKKQKSNRDPAIKSLSSKLSVSWAPGNVPSPLLGGGYGLRNNSSLSPCLVGPDRQESLF